MLLPIDGVDPDLKNDLGQTPLFLAAATGQASIVKLLLSIYDVNPRSVHLYSELFEYIRRIPLSIAASEGHLEAVRRLLELKQIQIPKTAGNTRLMDAASKCYI